MVGPVRLDQDLNSLPYIPPKAEFEERVLTRYPHPGTGNEPLGPSVKCPDLTATLLKSVWQPAPTIPPPLLTFEGVAEPQSGCGCAPPDTDGDVGPNHYVEAVNASFKVFDKNGTTLAGPTTYNSLFAPLVGTPCNGQNDGDPYVLYDPVADRWLVSDFAFPSFPGNRSINASLCLKLPSPVTGGWFLYALQVDPAKPNISWRLPQVRLLE